jgi:hypothetical protein
MIDRVGFVDLSRIESVVQSFLKDRLPEHRYASFDFCYNYFKCNDILADLELSCLHLESYLASWGMLRGSSFMLQKSIKHLEPAIKYIASLPKNYWEIDVDSYNNENIDKIIKIYQDIRNLVIEAGCRDLTLITKILLGVFAFVPAYDDNFCAAFRKLANGKNGNPRCGFRSLNKQSLLVIKQFYDENKEVIDKLSNSTFTITFSPNENIHIHYTKAKIIDMFGFIYGQHI